MTYLKNLIFLIYLIFIGFLFTKYTSLHWVFLIPYSLASIRNNPNVITGEEGRLLAESIPMDRREYALYFVSRELDYSEQYYKFKNATIEYLRNSSIKAQKELYSVTLKSIIPFLSGFGTHGYILYVPEEMFK